MSVLNYAYCGSSFILSSLAFTILSTDVPKASCNFYACSSLVLGLAGMLGIDTVLCCTRACQTTGTASDSPGPANTGTHTIHRRKKTYSVIGLVSSLRLQPDYDMQGGNRGRLCK